jgi:hypothetical protein
MKTVGINVCAILYIDTSTYTCVYAFVLENGICRERILQSQKPPGAPQEQPGERPQAATSGQERPGPARSGHEPPGAARSSQERPGAARSRQEHHAGGRPEAVQDPRKGPRTAQEAPGQPRSSPGAAQWRPEGGPGGAQEWPRSGPAAAFTANGYPYIKHDNIHEIRLCRTPATRTS